MPKRLLLPVIALFALAASPRIGAEILEQVLVKVNGEIITKTEFEARQVAALRSMPELANANPTNAEIERLLAEITPDLILDAVDELLLVQRGLEQGYALGDEQFEEIVDNIRTSNNLEDEAAFAEALRQEGMTMADLRRTLERNMLVQQVQRTEIVDKLNLTDEELRAYYDEHRQEFASPSEVTLREILFEVPNTERGINVALDDAARERAEEVRERLLAGESFAQLAGQFSAAPSRANGGLIGPLRADELAPAIQELLAGMEVGELTEPLRTPRGYQLLRLESRSASTVRPFEESRSAIANILGEAKIATARQAYVDQLRRQATIVWRNDELQRAYESALAARTAAAAEAEEAPPVTD